uniref:Protein kinase domain-containing protein n=1 Tax=Macrostomum lignano TaxID=282301 RepID=A0A1I8FE36_9PLAT
HVIGRINATVAEQIDSSRLANRIATESSDTSEIFSPVPLDRSRRPLDSVRPNWTASSRQASSSSMSSMLEVVGRDHRSRSSKSTTVNAAGQGSSIRPLAQQPFGFDKYSSVELGCHPTGRRRRTIPRLVPMATAMVRYSILSPPEETLPFHLDADNRTPRAGAAAATQSPVWPALNLRIRARDGDAEAAAAASDSSTTSVIDAPSKLWPTKVGGGGDRAEGAGSGGERGGGSSDSLLIAAGLASVTCAFVLILASIALTGQSHLQHHQHHQQRLSASSASSATCSWQLAPARFRNAARLTSAEGRRQRCSPTAAVDFRDDAAAAEATETVPMTATSGKSRWDERQRQPAADCGVTSERPNRIDLSAPLRCWSPQAAVTQSAAQTPRSGPGAPAVQQRAARRPPKLTYITLMVLRAARQTRSKQQQAAAE